MTWLSSAFHLRVDVIASKNLMDLLFFSKYCRKAQIKKRKTRLIDLIKNQNYQWTLTTHLDLDLDLE